MRKVRVAQISAVLLAVASAAAALPGGAVRGGSDPKADLQKDLRDTGIVGAWIYDDIDAGFLRAVKEKKPVCVVFR